jgi:hypothetical protein
MSGESFGVNPLRSGGIKTQPGYVNESKAFERR